MLKFWIAYVPNRDLVTCFSALQRAEIAEIQFRPAAGHVDGCVSVLFNEPKLLKSAGAAGSAGDRDDVSVLFNEPKLLKFKTLY